MASQVSGFNTQSASRDLPPASALSVDRPVPNVDLVRSSISEADRQEAEADKAEAELAAHMDTLPPGENNSWFACLDGWIPACIVNSLETLCAWVADCLGFPSHMFIRPEPRTTPTTPAAQLELRPPSTEQPI